MKKLMLILVTALLLAGCGILPASTSQPTPSDAEMATKVSKILTAMPSASSQPVYTPTVKVIPPTAIMVTATELAPSQPVSTSVPATTATVTIQAASLTPMSTSTLSASVTPAATISQTAAASLTPLPGDPRVKLGSPNYRDTMDNTALWPIGEDDYTKLSLKDGQMILTGLSSISGWRLTFPKLKDFYMEESVKTQTCADADIYGLFLRVPELKLADRGYLFGFSCDGKYALQKWDGTEGSKGTQTSLIDWKTSTAIKAGSNQVNRLGIMAVGGRLILYANGVLLGEAKDTSFSEGYFGVFIAAKKTQNFTVLVDEISYWENPQP